MGVKYDGKSPSKLWYFWQKTKAMMQTPFNHTTRPDAKRFGIDTAKTVGVLGAANIALMIPVVTAAPIVPWVVGGVAIYFAFKYGRDAFQKFGALKETAFVSNYVRDQEDKWLERKKAGNILTRIKNAITAPFKKIPAGVMKAAKWVGLGLAAVGLTGATAGLLGHFGVVPALSTMMATVAGAGIAAGVAIGAAALAVPVGIGMFVIGRNATAGSNAKESPFKFKKPSENAEPIEKGVVFSPEGKSFDFNETAKPAVPAKPSNDDAILEARRKAAEERAKNKSRRDNSKKF